MISATGSGKVMRVVMPTDVLTTPIWSGPSCSVTTGDCANAGPAFNNKHTTITEINNLNFNCASSAESLFRFAPRDQSGRASHVVRARYSDKNRFALASQNRQRQSSVAA